MDTSRDSALGEGSILDGDNWAVLRGFFPPGWEQAAFATGAVNRMRGLSKPEMLLRILLLHLANGYSLSETAARATQAGWADISAVTVFNRLRAAEQWLRWLAEHQRPNPELPVLPGRRLRAVDATVVSKPGSHGTDWRIHYALDLDTLQCDFFELTDGNSGETYRRVPVKAGDVLIGDRGYSHAPGIAHVLDNGGDVLVRYHWHRLPLLTPSGRRFALWSELRRLRVGQPAEWSAAIRAKEGAPMAGRLIAVKRSASATRLVRKRMQQNASKKQTRVSEPAWRAAEYVQLWTTLPAEEPSARVLQLYRARWQVELAFKRMKSLMQIGHLPKSHPLSGRAWLHGKLFVGLLAETMIAVAETFSPWGYPLPPTAEPLARSRLYGS
jgi:hypothetical protein